MSPSELDLSSKASLALEYDQSLSLSLWEREVEDIAEKPVTLSALWLGLRRWVEGHENISCFLFLFQEYANSSICSMAQVDQEVLTVGFFF